MTRKTRFEKSFCIIAGLIRCTILQLILKFHPVQAGCCYKTPFDGCGRVDPLVPLRYILKKQKAKKFIFLEVHKQRFRKKRLRSCKEFCAIKTTDYGRDNGNLAQINEVQRYFLHPFYDEPIRSQS